PSKRAVAVYASVGKQVGAAVAFQFRVALITRTHPHILTPRCNAGYPPDEVAGSAFQASIDPGFLLWAGNKNTGNSGALDALTSKILPLEPPPCKPTEITTDRRI